MNRKMTTLYWLCLLCLFPLSSMTQTLTKYDYWIDDDIANVQTGSLSGTEAEVNFQIDASKLSLGVHKISFRVAQSNGYYSAISSLHFLRGIVGNDATLEYWFDDNFEYSETMPISNTEEIQEFKLDLRNNNLFPIGFHKLNMRAIVNGYASPVYTSHVLKLLAGNPSLLEYWLDGDISGSKTVECTRSDDGSMYVYADNLDLDGVSPGYHRLFWRAVSSSKRTVTAVMSAPVIVKSRYNVDKNQLIVEKYSIAVDNEEPIEFPIVQKKEVVNIPHTLDARYLSLGEHTLKASIINSLGTSLTLKKKFTVVAQDNPSINLTGRCYDGWLHLDFNSIPNDISYTIIEIGVDGIENVISKRVASFYPEPINALPSPKSIGVATYYVKATYFDRYGHEQEVKSNEVTLENTSPPATSLYGCIVGRIQFGGQSGNTLLSPHKHLFVNFSDGNNEEKVLVNPNGTFNRDNIPFGTTFTLSIDDDDYYNYESITVNVDKETRNQIQVIKATAHDDVAVSISNENVDLTATSFSWDERTFNFEVVNTSSSYQTFSGVLEMIAFKSKQYHDAVFEPTKQYYHAGSTYIKNLNCGKSTNVSITLDNLPKLNKNEFFTFYFITQKDEQSTTKQYKQLVFEDKKFTNPMTLPISPDPSIDDVEFPDFDSFIMSVLKIMKEMDTWNGPFYKELKYLGEKVDEYQEDDNYMALATKLGTGLLFSFCNDLKKAYKDVSKSTKPIREFYEEMRDVFTYSDKSPFDKYITINKKIFKLYGKVEKIGGVSTNPFLDIYTLYLDAAEHAVDKIEQYQALWTDIQLGDIFYNNNITFKIKMFKEKDWIVDLNPVYYFTSKQIADNINSIQIYLENGIGQVEMATYTATGTDESNEVILTRNTRPTTLYDLGYNSKRFWMEIIWQNGRVSHFPLYDEFTDWDRNGQDVKCITLTLKSADFSMSRVSLNY